ncbi:MAG: PASTA domain-containing protein [Acidimicrobiia bacterium]|nr:PASTA domain-containing protein [Acidimicrobiia bacterium]
MIQVAAEHAIEAPHPSATLDSLLGQPGGPDGRGGAGSMLADRRPEAFSRSALARTARLELPTASRPAAARYQPGLAARADPGGGSGLAMAGSAVARLIGAAMVFVAKAALTLAAVLGALLLAGTGALWMFPSSPVPAPVADLADAGRDLLAEKAPIVAPGAMADLTGVNLAVAKEDLREAGHRNIHSVDVRGERHVVWPRNWAVVAQEPAPGTPLVAGQAITLTVDKVPGAP